MYLIKLNSSGYSKLSSGKLNSEHSEHNFFSCFCFSKFNEFNQEFNPFFIFWKKPLFKIYLLTFSYSTEDTKLQSQYCYYYNR